MNSHKKQCRKNDNKDVQLRLAEIVFLDYIKKYRIENELTQPIYFKEELGINDVRGFIKKLIKKGYLIKKDETITVTDSGNLFLKKYDDYLSFFKLGIPYVTINEYQRLKKKVENEYQFEEIMIILLLEKIKALEKKDDIYSVKNIHYDVGVLYEKCNYIEHAMYHYIVALYLNISGIEYYDKFLDFMAGKIKKERLRDEYLDIYIEPYIIKSIQKLGHKYSDELIDTVYEKNKISINMCPKEKCKELVTEIVNGEFNSDKWQGWFKAAFNGLVKAVENQILIK